MKNKGLLILLSGGMILFTACGHSGGNERSMRDTVKNTYGVGKDTSKIDTSKTTTTTGDASRVDNSASGGTKIAKDTSKKKKGQ